MLNKAVRWHHRAVKQRVTGPDRGRRVRREFSDTGIVARSVGIMPLGLGSVTLRKL